MPKSTYTSSCPPPPNPSPSPISSSNLNQGFLGKPICAAAGRKQQQQIWDHHQAACGWPLAVEAEGPRTLGSSCLTLPSCQQRPGQLWCPESLRGIAWGRHLDLSCSSCLLLPREKKDSPKPGVLVPVLPIMAKELKPEAPSLELRVLSTLSWGEFL